MICQSRQSTEYQPEALNVGQYSTSIVCISKARTPTHDTIATPDADAALKLPRPSPRKISLWLPVLVPTAATRAAVRDPHASLRVTAGT